MNEDRVAYLEELLVLVLPQVPGTAQGLAEPLREALDRSHGRLREAIGTALARIESQPRKGMKREW